MRTEKPPLFTLMLVMWGIAIFAALANFYPFTNGRHNYYLLSFFVIPLGYELEYFVRSISYQRFAQYFGVTAIILTVIFLKQNDIYLNYFGEFSLKRKDFNAGQQFLDQHLQANDVIVTGGFSAYVYFPYAKDAGKTAYDGYIDVPYHHKTTVLAPYNPPFNPYHPLESFRNNLKSRLNSNITMPESKVWFVIYSWKNNIEIWHLLNCDAIQPQIHDYFSRDGVLIFSIQVKTVSNFLKENAAWEYCYSDYKPFLGSETFKAYPQITQSNKVTD